MIEGTLTRLTLVGTVHREPQGREKLISLLEMLLPDALTLEVSPYAIAFRRRRGPLLLARLETLLDRLAVETGRDPGELAAHQEVAGIRSLLALPFEFQAAADYAAAAGIPLDLLDSSLTSARKLRWVERELLTWDNLRVLVHLPVSSLHKENAATARRMVLGNLGTAVLQAFLAGRRDAEGIGPRDYRLAREIRRRLKGSAGRHLVHIGGWVHLVEDERGKTLFSLLEDLNPQRVLL
jgi:hypothetical protein